MPSTFDHATQVQQAGKGKVVVGDKKEPGKNQVGVTVTVALFFDGTLNNRYNTGARINQTAANKRYGGAGTSYANYYSNVSILESLNKKKEAKRKEISVYIEGEGTDYSVDEDGAPDFNGDSFKGYAFGSGDTGIPAKVKKGLDNIREQINARGFYNKSSQYIKEIKIHVFGFSRGAAAARHFIASKAELSDWWPLQKVAAVVTIQFVGIFDTVSSYHSKFSLSPNFNNDVNELQLRIGGAAKKVVHLVAGDEYRQNFASTTISSSIAANVGYECVLPGAHSDIGGGYAEVEIEERRFWNAEEMERLIHEGWYRRGAGKDQNQVFIHEERYESLDEEPLVARWTVGIRKIHYHYQLIPLAIMRALALKSNLDLEFEGFERKKYQQFEVPPELAAAKAILQELALKNDRAHRKVITFSADALGKMVRNRYLHRSAKIYDTANQVRRNKHGLEERQIIAG